MYMYEPLKESKAASSCTPIANIKTQASRVVVTGTTDEISGIATESFIPKLN